MKYVKRIFKTATLFFLLLFGLSGCIFNLNEGNLMIVFDEPIGSTKNSSDSVLYEVKRARQNLEENPVIEYTLKNLSTKELVILSLYYLEKYNKDYWEYIPTFSEALIEDPQEGQLILEPNNEMELAFTLDVYEDEKMKIPMELETGRYRIVQENFWNWNETNEIKTMVLLEFDIKKE